MATKAAGPARQADEAEADPQAGEMATVPGDDRSEQERRCRKNSRDQDHDSQPRDVVGRATEKFMLHAAVPRMPSAPAMRACIRSRCCHSSVAPIATSAAIAGRQGHGVIGVDDALSEAEDRARDDEPATPEQQGRPRAIGAGRRPRKTARPPGQGARRAAAKTPGPPSGR